MPDGGDRVELYWLPLGAGGWFVGWNGRLYEAILARVQRRNSQPLFHSALRVRLDGRWQVVEMAPVWNLRVPDRGVVAEGPVGARSLGRLRAFRYEVRRWPAGAIPDVGYAVGSPVRVLEGSASAAALLALVPAVPRLTWGRDELRVGDMWNSNSLVSWLLASSGADVTALCPPDGGRAPGWVAGVCLARQPATIDWVGHR